MLTGNDWILRFRWGFCVAKGVAMEGSHQVLEDRQVGATIYRLVQDYCPVGKVAYRLDQSDEHSQIQNTFHVSQLRKCLTDEAPVVSLDDIQVDESLNYIGRPVAILDRNTKVLRNKEVKLVKVQ